MYIYIYIYILASHLFLKNAQIPSLQRCKTPPSNVVIDMTQKNQIVMFQSWRFQECREPLHCHYSLVHSDPGGVRVWCMDDLELLNI